MKEIKEIIQSSNPKNPNSDKMKGWEIAEFEKCLEKVIYTNKIQRKDFKEEGIYPIVSQEKDFINGYWDNEDDIFRVDKPVVIFGDHTQVIKFVDFDFVLGADGVKILKPNDKIDPKYFYYFLQNIELGSLGYARHYRLLKEINVAFPKSLPEQQRIVSILDECFSAIERSRNNAEQNLKNAKEVFESYLQGVFGGSTGSPTKRDGWEEKRLGELATFRNGMNFTKSSKGEKINIVGVKDFQNSFWVPFETLETVTLEGNLNDLDLLQEGDIIVVRSNGNPQLIGRTLLASEVNGKVSHSGFTIRIRLNTKNIDPIYLCNYLKISSTRRILVDRGNGVGIKSLNQGSLSTLIIPYPKTLKEQQTIVLQLDALRAETQKLEAVYQKKLDDLEELKKSVLKREFAGEL